MEDIFPDDLWAENHGKLYSSPDPGDRMPIESLEELMDWEMFDANEEEIPIFNAGGKRVPRRRPLMLGGDQWPSCGLLQDLRLTQTLFCGRVDIPVNPEFDGELQEDRGFGRAREDDDLGQHETDDLRRLRRNNDTTYTTYPHFFSRELGQWQANGVIKPILPLLYDLNRNIRRWPGGGLCVEPISSQCYNTLAHRVRPAARLHLAQTGPMTAVGAGAWARTPKAERHANATYRWARTSLPHTRLGHKIANSGPKYFLRLENVFSVHPHRMTDEILDAENGFHDNVIVPLLNAGEHPTVVAAIKKTTVILNPEVRCSELRAHMGAS